MSSSLTLEGGTLAFMAPELLAPSKFGLKNAIPTQEGDVYAFGLVILQVIISCCRRPLVFLNFRQVLTGKQPFPNMRPPELAYNVSSGLRPDKPVDAQAIGISDSLWELVQKCWLGDRTRRPQIQEVVVGVGNAADKWRKDMPPSGVEYREDAAEEDSDELEHGKFSFFPVGPLPLRPSVQLGYFRRTRATGQLSARVPVLRSSTIYTLSWLDKMGWKPTRSLQSPCTNTWIRSTLHRLVAFLHGNAKDSGPSSRGFLGASRSDEHFLYYLRCRTRATCIFYNLAVVLS